MNHARQTKVIYISILVMLFILVSAMPATAKAEKVNFTGTTCIVSQSPPERFWISEDGIIHMRGIVTKNVDVTDSPYDTGSASMIMNVDINPLTGEAHGYGTFILSPTAYSGTWEGHWSTHISPDGLRGLAVGHGTGELEGLQIFNNMTSDDPSDPCTNSSIRVLVP
jgi:hypothetical protein